MGQSLIIQIKSFGPPNSTWTARLMKSRQLLKPLAVLKMRVKMMLKSIQPLLEHLLLLALCFIGITKIGMNE